MKNKLWLVGTTFSFLIAMAFAQGMTSIRSIDELGAQDLQITFHPLAEYPDVCQDNNGNIWITYTELNDNQERIILKKISNFAIVDSMVVNQVDGLESFPRICCDSQDRIWITWCAKRNDKRDIIARYLKGDKWSDEIRITDDPQADLHPTIGVAQSGDIWIVWESLRNGNFDILASRIADDRPLKPVAVSKSQDMDLRPIIIPTKENYFTICWDRQCRNGYQVMMNCLTKQGWSGEIPVSPENGFNMAPAGASDPKGNLTLAWQTNLKPDGHPDYNHWLLLRQIKQTKPDSYLIIEEPGDRQKIREDQGLEFPTVAYDRAGRLWLFSRASQDFYAQCFTRGKKSPLYNFNVTGWGGRGVNIRAIRGHDGYLYSIRRDLKFIYLNRLDTEKASLTYEKDWQVTDDFPISKDDQPPVPPVPELHSGEIKLPDGFHFYFGDIHQHSALSDGVGTVDECYTRSSAVFRQDFAALTDHEWFTGNFILPSEWEWIKLAGQQATRAGEFTAVPAYEWTTPRLPDGFGHKNIYFPSFDAPLLSYNSDARTATDLFKFLKSLDAIAIPHHVAWTGTDWESYDSPCQPVAEIVSTHGVFEYMGNEPIMHRGGLPGYFIQDGLKMGKKFGFVGGSDGHGLKWHHGIGYKESEFNSGLTVVIARENSLPAIFEALKARRVYATSGSRIYIDFRINDEWMGAELDLRKKPEIAIKVKGSAPLHRVDLIRDGETILVLGKDLTFGLGVSRTLTDLEVLPGKHYYYLRVLQEDGEMAWSSPIWVNLNE